MFIGGRGSTCAELSTVEDEVAAVEGHVLLICEYDPAAIYNHSIELRSTLIDK